MVTFVPFEPQLLPSLVNLWNSAFRSQRNFRPITEEIYRSRIIRQRAFDPGGLILAMADGDVAAFVHAIGPCPQDILAYRDRRCLQNGSIAALAVARRWRRKGVGSELLSRAESYLAGLLEPGRTIFCGDYDVPLYHTLEGPRQPFWGDTEVMGVSEDAAEFHQFLLKRRYRLAAGEGHEITMAAEIGERDEPRRPPLDRIGLREVRVSDRQPWTGRIGWYPEGSPCGYMYPLFGHYQHEVIALARGDEIGSHLEWYPMRQVGCVALLDFQVAAADRGQGLGSYLLDKFLWLMMQRGYGTVELHTHTAKNDRAYHMYLRRGFSVAASWVTLEKPFLADQT